MKTGRKLKLVRLKNIMMNMDLSENIAEKGMDQLLSS